MQFTGENLVLVWRGVDYALAEIHNQIATCPDVFEYAEHIADLEAEQERFRGLKERIERALEREGYTLEKDAS
jgi:hypothetical protein